MSAEQSLPPLWRAALEVALDVDGVDAAVAATGVVYDRDLGERFPRRGNVNDAQILVQSLVRASLLVARMTGDTPSAELFNSLSKRLGSDLAQASFEDVANIVGHVGPFELRDTAALIASMYADEADALNRTSRLT